MPKLNDTGVYQLKNGYWGFRYVIVVNGERIERRRNVDEVGNPYKTKTSAVKARQTMIEKERLEQLTPPRQRKTMEQVFDEYCETGRTGRAYGTIKKQDSLWLNHLKAKYGKRYVDDISTAEINDYLSQLYYDDNRAYSYVESFLKMFYLIFGQAYSRNYLDAERYDKLCKNKDTKIHMPKMKIDEDTDIAVYSDDEMQTLTEYFTGTNAETAFLLGKYCGLRINECYGLKWSNVDFSNGIIRIDRQMQYQNGVVKLVSVKTRNARREIVMAEPLKEYLLRAKQARDTNAMLLAEQREQNQTFLADVDNKIISSLELVNSLDNGKIQTVNSMKYHWLQIKTKHSINFRYHHLRHTYGTRLAMMNTPMHILCKQMGHASGRVTQMYYLGASKEGMDILKANLDMMK